MSQQQPNYHSQQPSGPPGPPPQAHFDPRHGSPAGHYSSPPPQAGHYSTPPPGWHGSSPPPQQGGYGPPQQYGPPHPQPGMTYPPQQQQWVLLGFQNTLSQSRAVYGPPGAQFDGTGVYYPHEGGSREYVTPYRGYDGRVREPPQPEEDCCGFWHWIGYRTDYYWQSGDPRYAHLESRRHYNLN
ncbi:hypothetical protein QBC46DRAFT_396114 [Diplogelasinospora grovesii]|uniref:Uncharacterized protein n=1 Tax=Diplogelasinospora grovesii TaxID=303347 RepID=A0AAN6N0M6_9PEZI|nr:hypothetical protein QBC46DRAFT_396114 [Diplogelasinospora grovesii]